MYMYMHRYRKWRGYEFRAMHCQIDVAAKNEGLSCLDKKLSGVTSLNAV
jgi:hypothetical protein